MNVLIVDDMDINRRLLRAVLEADGHHVSEGADGVAALALLESGNFDAIISDILMPKMDGYRLCSEVRASQRFRNLPFVFYTSSYTSAGDERLALGLGADRFVRKPAPAQDILSALTESVATGHQQKPAVKIADPEVLREYSERLIAKLEQRNAELASANEQLEHEVSERKRAEEARGASEARYRTLFEYAPDGIVIADPEGYYIDANASICRMLGYTRDELIGLHASDIVAQTEIQHIGPALSVIKATSDYYREWQFRRKDGSLFAAEVIATMMPDGNLLAMIRDITERVRNQEARAQLETQLRQAQKMEALGTLAGGIAHDFNNILGAIIGNTELARQDVGPNHPATESLTEIRKASHRAKDLVQRILTFGRKQQQPQSVIPLRPIVEEAVALLRATLPAGVELATAFDTETPTVRADPTQIHQVLMNLCTNAWHAMGGDQGRIDICLDGITVGAEAAGTAVNLHPGSFARVMVSDTGSGMDAATLERIFDPFFTTKPVDQGTGLGLSVVHGIVETHDGAVTVKSEQGVGTTFSLYFPEAQALLPSPTPEGAEIAPLPAVDGQHVLYLDDDKALVFLMTRLLERPGFRVSGYTRAEEALAALRADPGQFDLVITDMNMPRLSGLDVARQVLSLRPDLPVVLVSGNITEELRAAAALIGVHHLIYKPNTTDEMVAVVQRLAGPPRKTVEGTAR